MKTTLHLIIIIMFLLGCSGCASMLRYDGPYEGKVIDADTLQPIEGVVIHGRWIKRYLGGGSEFYDSREILTDKNGKFKIPGKGLLVLSEIQGMYIILFKAGYKEWSSNLWVGLKNWPNGPVSWSGDKGTFKLKRLTLEERRNRSVDIYASEPDIKQRLLRLEYNKEMIESGKTSSPVFSVE